MSDTQTLERRVAKLERTNRALLGAVVLAGVGAVLAAQDGPDAALAPIVRTNTLEIVDQRTGSVSARLGTDNDGGALSLLDPADGTLLAFLGGDQDGGVMQLDQRAGEGLVYLGNDPDGGLVLVEGAGGEPLILLGVVDARGVLTVSRPGDRTGVTLLADQGSGAVFLHNDAGEAAYVLRVHEDGTASVQPFEDD